MKDCVYYIEVNEEVLYEFVFNNEALAIEFAEENAIKDYEIVEWVVD